MALRRPSLRQLPPGAGGSRSQLSRGSCHFARPGNGVPGLKGAVISFTGELQLNKTGNGLLGHLQLTDSSAPCFLPLLCTPDWPLMGRGRLTLRHWSILKGVFFYHSRSVAPLSLSTWQYSLCTIQCTDLEC